MIRTVIVEDNMFMQKHLTVMISENKDYEVVASLRDAFEAEKLCRTGNIDLVLMDVQTLHNHSGLSAGKNIRGMEKIPECRQERKKHPKVVIVTSLIDPQVLERAKAGAADSLWYKDHGDDELMDVIERTVSGEHIFPESSPSVELKDMFSEDISPKQMEILRRFVKGMTYHEIAEELKLSMNGVRWNLDQIIEKGGFVNKHEMLAAVIENKLIVTTLKEGKGNSSAPGSH